MIKANASGELTGKFTIPASDDIAIPAGVKTVVFEGKGENGSRGFATYTGSGQIRTETLAQVTTITTERFDPLAQTFTLQQSRFIAAVELYFTAKGAESVQVQIREVVQGIPTQTVLAQSRMQSDDISLSDATLFEFTPVFLQAGQEYAIVVLTDGADHEVAIAELGEFDQQHGWVTSQPYQVGVLLSSSNASTWTPHQNKDLTFKLKAAKFTQNTQSVELGSVAAHSVSDLMALAVVQRPSSQTDVDFTFKVAGSNEVLATVQEWSPRQLRQKLNDTTINVTANLTGSELLSPVLFAGSQCALGEVEQNAQYITREITCHSTGQFTVSFDAVLEGTASIEVYLLDAEHSTAVALSRSTINDDGWKQLDYIHTFAGQTTTPDQNLLKRVRLKLILNGNEASRPRVKNLRAFST
ncbi:hypothetical protein PSECIP111951_01162 [Pseudoalteromonas holothuriae]|uniref:Uncharacterized protein n=1 Tax=Pseudoalteromonas holothuriae TaxID=2963714 RepID=A0ABN8UIN7_9GAMM|nr:hypothetical protein [Pseudoalteromonas sp. CIP111951]CAH9055051.1 hypothetical protein PSECIP111951_01162 [Pseudoalteromonas sp. CIP111951]